ncbi:TPA: IS256 family transposase [Aeromonas dhakensis]|nr:IS256 family transposase [Aeromonas dhakensis]
MAAHSMSFQDTLAQLGGEDFLRDLTEFMLNRIMEADVAQRINAERHERTDERETYRNGFRDRQFNTRLGTLALRIPKLREGMYFPPFLEARRLSEKALNAVIQEAWINGVSTRKVDALVQSMGMTGISRSQVSAICRGIDERVQAFLQRPLEGEWPYLWLDATYVKVRKDGRVVSVAVIIACAVSLDGRREIIGMGIGESEAKPFWLSFLLGLKERGLQGVKLVISDSHSGLKAAIEQVFCASWQRCRVHFMRNVLGKVNRTSQSVVRAALQQVFVQSDEKSAHATWREVAHQLEKRFPAVTQMMDEAEADVLAYFSFPKPHRVKLHSTNTLERLNKEVKRRADVVGIFPNEESIMRLLGAVLAEQNEEWLLQNSYLPQQSMTEINRVSDEVIEALPRSA